MLFPKSWFSGRRVALSARRSHVVDLEARTLLAATISWSVQGSTGIRVEGTDGDDMITVGLTVGGNFDVNGTDTEISSVGRTQVAVMALDGADTITLDASLGAIGSNVRGGLGDDVMVASNSGTNTLRGDEGADTYSGGSGRDTYLIDEFDTVVADAGGAVDTIDAQLAGAGVTVALGAAGIERIFGSDFNDLINATGESIPVVISGQGGNDTLTGGNGNDVIRGQSGNDRLNGGGGNDFLVGEEGNDTIDGGAGADTISYSLSTGPVTINLALGTVVNDGAGGNDTILSQSVENAWGSNFGDTITGNAVANFLRGSGGNDTILGGLGDDELEGNDGNDTLRGQAGMDRVDGGNGNDFIQADSLDDDSTRFTGGAGVDTLSFESTLVAVVWILKADSSFQTINGSSAGDSIDASLQAEPATINGNPGADLLIGTAFNDTLVGGAGNDTLIGGDGIDVLRGGADDDLLIGGTLLVPDDGKADTLFGDAGNDRAVGSVAGTPGTIFALDTRNGLESVIL